MRKHYSKVCKLRPCLATESTNSARMRTIVTAAAIYANGTYFLDNLRDSTVFFYQLNELTSQVPSCLSSYMFKLGE